MASSPKAADSAPLSHHVQVQVLRLHEVAAFMGKHQHPLQACDPPVPEVTCEEVLGGTANKSQHVSK